jgi:hypothetical protein
MIQRLKPLIFTLILGGLATFLILGNQQVKKDYADKLAEYQRLCSDSHKAKITYQEHQVEVKPGAPDKKAGTLIRYDFKVAGNPYTGSTMVYGNVNMAELPDSAFYLAENPAVNATNPPLTFRNQQADSPGNIRLYMAILLLVVALPWFFALIKPGERTAS